MREAALAAIALWPVLRIHPLHVACNTELTRERDVSSLRFTSIYAEKQRGSWKYNMKRLDGCNAQTVIGANDLKYAFLDGLESGKSNSGVIIFHSPYFAACYTGKNRIPDIQVLILEEKSTVISCMHMPQLMASSAERAHKRQCHVCLFLRPQD